MDQRVKEEAWIAKGQAAVREQLRDPDSAQFKDAFFHRGADGVPMSCGLVNAKNAFGGYVGWSRYVSGGSSDVTFVESTVGGGFADVWTRFCAQ